MATSDATPPTTEPATVALSDAPSPLRLLDIEDELIFAMAPFDVDVCCGIWRMSSYARS